MEQHSDFDDEPVRWPRPPRTTPPVIDRRVLPNGEVKEWERGPSIPDDFIYDPEADAYYPPGEPSMYDAAAASRELQEVLKQERRGGLISRDQLLAAKALITPDKRRKTLGGGPQRKMDLFDAMLKGDDADNVSEPESEEEDEQDSAD